MRPANSARRSPAEASPRHWTRTCSGSMNSGRAINVTRGARMISIWVSGVRCQGVPDQVELGSGPTGGALDFPQPTGDVFGDRCGVRPDFQTGEWRPVGGGKYNTGVQDRARGVDALQVAAQRDDCGPVEALQ